MDYSQLTVDEIRDEIYKLERAKEERIRKEYEDFIERAKENVGRCFKIDRCFFVKVIGVPPLYHHRFGVDYNPYQYPAFYLSGLPHGDNRLPFYYDNLFSGAWGEGHNLNSTTYTEISAEEFEVELNKRIDALRDSLS